MIKSEFTFESVLEPISVDDFFVQYWEKKPLHISRSNSAYFSELLALSDIEHALSTYDLVFPKVQLTQSNKAISVSDYADADNRILPHRFVQQHSDGATMVFSQANTLLPKLADFCRHIHNALQMQCQTNVYLTPANSQGFKAHYDTHDVFIIQVSGTKTFNFYNAGVQLPFVHDAFDRELIRSDDIVESVQLQPGDSLYIPRGLVHDAVSHNDTSLHITLGVFAVVVRDLLLELVQIASEANMGMRTSIPRKLWQKNEADPAELNLESMLAQALQPASVETALSRLRDDVAMSGLQSSQNLLSPVLLIDGSSSTDRFVANRQAIMSVEWRDTSFFVRSSGKVLEFSERLGLAIEWILSADDCGLSDLPELDEDQKIALFNRLLRENILTPVSA
ncbi:MAG: cupin domain-containing protein [Granulosicoccus sp.]